MKKSVLEGAKRFILYLVLPLSFISCTSSNKAAEVRDFPNPPEETGEPAAELRTAVLAGGCFWGVEGVFEQLEGVSHVVSGYAGGAAEDASYGLVSMGATGHAESVLITYDPSVISYGTLLQVFFHIAHDPTQLNYQGPDRGPQYRSSIFYADEEERQLAQEYIATLEDAGYFPAPIVTELTPLKAFYPAEDYHQDFMKLNPDYPYIVRYDQPKVDALRKSYPTLLARDSDSSMSTWEGLAVWPSTEAREYPITKSEEEWRKQLDSFAYRVLREQATEYPGTGELLNEHRSGTFYSAASGQPLFRSEAKFESGTGWPSFSKPINQDAVVLILDGSYGMERVEVVDSSSGSHLGHVFNDGPLRSGNFESGTGLRYCINSASLLFVPDGETPPELVLRYGE